MAEPAARGRFGADRAGAAFEVVRSGPLTTVQDLGRPGWAHLGVPRSGALDRAAAALANRLAGNPPEAALLETTVGGVALRSRGGALVAVTGAPAPIRVGGHPVEAAVTLGLHDGDVLDVGAATAGVRCYVAVAGGLDVEPVLGSRSTDVLSGLGPPPLRDGQVLPVGRPSGPPGPIEFAITGAPAEAIELPFDPGPRLDWFEGDLAEALAIATYRVDPTSNRVGLRLAGPPLARRPPLVRRRADELASEGIVLGAVQVPPDGCPLVFLADHPTTGGYPVIGVVDAAALDRCAQARPGTAVSLRLRRPRVGAGYGSRP